MEEYCWVRFSLVLYGTFLYIQNSHDVGDINDYAAQTTMFYTAGPLRIRSWKQEIKKVDVPYIRGNITYPETLLI